MKKRYLLMTVVIGIGALMVFSRSRSVAQNSPIQSEGNFIMESENVRIYSDDIKYLKTEIDKLLDECK